MIKASVVNNRVNCVPSAFGLGTGHVKHATRPARLPSPMFVAAVEEPQTSSDIDEGIDRDALYARFESLLGDYAVSLSQGDKVRSGVESKSVSLVARVLLKSTIDVVLCRIFGNLP